MQQQEDDPPAQKDYWRYCRYFSERLNAFLAVSVNGRWLVSCGRGLFATHYHKLADAHADDPTTSIRHMACHVDRDAAGREQVLQPRLF